MPKPHSAGSTTDLRGKDRRGAVPAVADTSMAFQEQDGASNSSSTPTNGSDSSYRPVSPSSPPDASRKRPSSQRGPAATKDDFALPPPPTRSRKIIQMKPKQIEPQGALASPATTSPVAVSRTLSASQPSSGGGKRKQHNGGTTAAGRKVARKTAHSLIERRRRSKMNEEFGVLKEMIPACQGQEMHKLAILQASIEYLRYLQQCVADLQAQNSSPKLQPPPTSITPDAQDDLDDEVEGDDVDNDEEMRDDMDDDAAPAPAAAGLEHAGSVVSLPSLSQITTASTTSPSVFSTGAGRHYSISSASQASYSPYIHSNQTSPAFGPQLPHMHPAPPFSASTFGLGSPALKPADAAVHTLHPIAQSAVELADRQQQQQQQQQRSAARSSSNNSSSSGGGGGGKRSEQELDQEAAAALSMLNNDRRRWRAADATAADLSRASTTTPAAATPITATASTSGMSVRDLLIS